MVALLVEEDEGREVVSKFDVLSKIDPEAYSRTEGDTRKLVLRVLSILGYDIFDPSIVAEEYTCDVGTKRGEKVDFALLNGDDPWCLIEVKRVGTSIHLDRHKAQLYRYFGTSKARIAILTDGLIWEFYSDSSDENVMDLTPFTSIDIRSMSPEDESTLDLVGAGPTGGDLLRDMAHGTAQKRRVMAYLSDAARSPSNELIKLLGREACGIDRMTSKRMEAMTPIVEDAISSLMDSDHISVCALVRAVIEAREILVTPIEPDGDHIVVQSQILVDMSGESELIPGYADGSLTRPESILLYEESVVARYREITGCGGGVRPYCMAQVESDEDR